MPTEGAELKSELHLTLAATFRCTAIVDSLQRVLTDAGIARRVNFAQFTDFSEYLVTSQPGSKVAVLLRIEDWLREDLKLRSDGSFGESWMRNELRVRIDEFVRQFTILSRLANQVWFVAVPSAGWISQANNLQGLCRTYTNLLVARVRTLRGVSVLNWPTSVSADESTDRETDRLDHIPFTEDACYKLGEWVGDEIARGIAQSSDKVITSGTGRSELAAYLASLQVRIDLAPPRASERPHVDHILRTAASFSLTGENPIISEHEIDAVLRSARCLVISVSDRISDCGPSGLIAFSISGDVLIVNRFALSCRVLGKQVEYAAVSALASIAAERACTRIEFAYVETPRNQPMVAFLQQVARRSREGAYVLPAGDVEAKIIQTAVNPSAWTLNTPDLAEHDVLVGSSLEQQQ